MWDFTLYLYSKNLSLKCESHPHGNLSFEWKSFSSTSIFMLESTCSKYLHRYFIHETRCLDPLSRGLLIQEIPELRIHCRHLICLNRSQSRIIDSYINYACAHIKSWLHAVKRGGTDPRGLGLLPLLVRYCDIWEKIQI